MVSLARECGREKANMKGSTDRRLESSTVDIETTMGVQGRSQQRLSAASHGGKTSTC